MIRSKEGAFLQMNILFITDDLHPCQSGIAVFSENVIPHLRKEGHQVTVFGPKGCPTADHQLPTFKLKRLYPRTEALWVFPNWKLLKCVLFNKYDAIHINCPSSLTGVPVCLLAAFRKTKVVFYNHGNVAVYCKFHQQSAFSTRISLFLYYLPQILFNPVIVQNPGCSDLPQIKKKKFDWKEGACGINLELFQFSPSFEKYHLVSVGRLSEEKNWIRLLQLFSHLPKYYKLTIVGSGEQEKELKKYCEEQKLDNVTFAGRMPQTTVSAYLQKAQAYLSASLFETWGLTLTEALACGTPVVYPNHIPFDTLYNKEFPEGLYEIEEAKSFVEAVLKTEKADAESRNKCRRYAENFTWEKATQKLIEIYGNS